ncbi:MAG: hypothetical protein SFU56_01855 [Capsulimonadales bacterium]|nr:hypothetical protein [Capsulimonadales bacterium]
MAEQSAEQTANPETPDAVPAPKKQQVPPAVTAIVVVFLLGFIAWQFTLYFKMPRFGRQKPVGEIVMEKVIATDGDIKRLSKEELDQLNNLTMGNGEKYFNTYAEQRAKQAKPAAP